MVVMGTPILAMILMATPRLAMPKQVIVIMGNLLRGPLILEMVLMGQPYMSNDCYGHSNTSNA